MFAYLPCLTRSECDCLCRVCVLWQNHEVTSTSHVDYIDKPIDKPIDKAFFLCAGMWLTVEYTSALRHAKADMY